MNLENPWIVSENAPNLMLKNIEYMDADRVYINVNDIFDVKIVRTDEGIVIDVFPAPKLIHHSGDEPIATTDAYDNEAFDPEKELQSSS